MSIVTVVETQVIVTSETEIDIIEVGFPGDKGETGETGEGVPAGGATGDSLLKSSNDNFDTEWGRPTTTITGDATGSGAGTVVLTLATVNSSVGTFSKVTVNDKGLITSATNIGSSDVTTALGYTPVNPSTLGVANGIATLDSSGKLTAAQIPDALVGAVVYQGVWNANTNSPTLTSGVGTKGRYYKVSVAGTTTIDGHSTWDIGDTIIFDGTVWDKIDGADVEIVSVAGKTGVVSLVVGDISGAAPLASPTFTGSPAAPTPSTGDSSTLIATTAYVKAQGYTTNTGTVTSVAVSGANGIGISGSPVTTSGTIALSLGDITPTSLVTAGVITSSLNGAASASAFNLTGTPFAGTGTTSTPLFYINNGTAPTSWAAAGTHIGINAAAASTANFLDFHVNGGASVFSVSSTGQVNIPSQIFFSGTGNISRQVGFGGVTFNSDNSIDVGNNGAKFVTSTMKLGTSDAVSPSAATISMSNVLTGTSNTAGANFFMDMSQGRGTGAGGSYIVRTAPAGSTGSALNALVTALTIDSTQTATFTGTVACSANLTVATTITAGNTITAGATFAANAASRLTGNTNGTWIMSNNGNTGFTSLQLGPNVVAPTSVAIQAGSVIAGTSNTASGNLTYQVGQSTGSVGSGSHIFQVTAAGTAGTTQNAYVTALTIDNTSVATFASTVVANAIQSTTNVRAGATGFLYWNGRSSMKSTADGSISFRNNADSADSAIAAAAGTFSGNVTAPQLYATTQTLTPGTTVAWNMASGANANLTPAQNFTLSNPTNLVAGSSGMLTITQDGTGSRVITWGSAYKFTGGTKFVLSTAASSIDKLAWHTDGTNVYVSALGAFS